MCDLCALFRTSYFHLKIKYSVLIYEVQVFVSAFVSANMEANKMEVTDTSHPEPSLPSPHCWTFYF